MKISCIVLGAGLSSRFNDDKLLAPWENTTVLEQTLCKIKSYPFHEMILVTSRKIAQQYSDRFPPIQVVMNEKQHLGISYSIKLGVQACSESDSYFFIVGDQPLLSFETLQSFLENFEASTQGIGCVCYQEMIGNPVVFKNSYKEELLGLSGDVGGKKVVHNHLSDVYKYQVMDEWELKDIDTLKDYELICKYKSDEV